MNITPGNWKTHELDRRVLVDDQDNIIAELRTWQDTDDGKAIAQVPQMLNLVQRLADPKLTWTDPWIYELRKIASKILWEIENKP